MIRKLLPFALALSVAAPAFAQAPPVAPPASTPLKQALYRDGYDARFLLDGQWLFRLDPQDQGLGQGFQREVTSAGWNPIEVPNAWNAGDNSDDSQRGTVGWYRKDFKAPKAAIGSVWNIRFESVNYRATVFLNGREIGTHEGAYIPFEVPAGKLKSGINRLVIRVDNRRTDTDIPPLRDQTNTRPGGGWWNYGGLLREVYIRPIKTVDLGAFSAIPSLPRASGAATVAIKGTVTNIGRGTRKIGLRVRVGGRPVRIKAVKVKGRSSKTLEGKIRLRNPRVWSQANPQLTKVRAAAVVKGRATSSLSTKIGIRSFKVSRTGRFLVNGKPAKLRGASFHEDSPDKGAALTPAHRANYVNWLQELGANFTRAHYPVHPAFIEEFDRLGIIYYEQIPFYQYRAETLRLKSVRTKGLAYLEAAVSRDVNHASVAVWSIGNELPTRVSPGQRNYVNSAKRLLDKVDPSRLATIDYAGYPSIPPIGPYRVLDGIGINSYFGWYIGPNGQIVDRELLGPYMDQLHAYYPRQALFITEFGAESNREGPIDEKGTFAFQADFMDFHVSTYESRPYINGYTTWILQDFRCRPDWDGGNPKPTPPYNGKGLIAPDGSKKPAFYETQRLFRGAIAAENGN